MSKFLDLEGLGYYTQCFKPGLVELVDGGAKNLFNPSNYKVVSTSGVTPTPNSDGTYTLSGAASGSTADFLYTAPSVYTNMYGLKAGGTYTIVSGDDKVLIRVDASTNPSSQWNKVLVENVANKATFTIPNNVVGLWIRIRVPVASGSVDNVIVTPMICTKPTWDISHTYQPYRPTEDEQNMIIDSKANLENVSYKTATSSFSGTNMQVVFDEDMFSQSSFRGSVLMMFGTQKASVNNSLLLVDFYDSGIKSIRYLTSGTGEVITAIGTIHNNKHGFNFTADANSYTYPCCLSLFANKDIQPKFTVSVVT